jgi:Zn-dependent peptidase ImmA (M78 family)
MKFKYPPEKILKDLGIYEPDNIDLELIAFSLNAEVKCVPLSSAEGSIIGSESKAIIKVNSNAQIEKRRFSLGHELGHWINDKGNNLTFNCSKNDMKQFKYQKNNFKQNKEVRANQFSAELIMPKFIFSPFLVQQKINFLTVKELANTFNTSITSTAIRLVEITEFPCLVACWTPAGKRKWFFSSSTLPEEIWPFDFLSTPRQVLQVKDSSDEVDGDTWLQGDIALNYNIFQSIFFNGYDYISLLWWEDESQLDG